MTLMKRRICPHILRSRGGLGSGRWRFEIAAMVNQLAQVATNITFAHATQSCARVNPTPGVKPDSPCFCVFENTESVGLFLSSAVAGARRRNLKSRVYKSGDRQGDGGCGGEDRKNGCDGVHIGFPSYRMGWFMRPASCDKFTHGKADLFKQ